MTLDSICKVGFGVEIGTLSPDLPENSFAQAFDAANIIVTLRFIDPLWRVKKFLHVGSEALLEQSIRLVDEFTYSVIRRRKAEIVQARTSGKQEKVRTRSDRRQTLDRWFFYRFHNTSVCVRVCRSSTISCRGSSSWGRRVATTSACSGTTRASATWCSTS
jgi:hypothetical protein